MRISDWSSDVCSSDLILFFATPHEGEVSVNSTRVTNVCGTNVWDLNHAEWQSRRQMQQISDFLRRHVPGFADAYVAQSGGRIGVREGRRVVGDYRSEEHTSELQSLMRISYAVFC